MESRDPELAKELDATLRARRELGTEYEQALIESFLEKAGQRMDAAVDTQVRRRLAEQQVRAVRGTHGSGRPAGNVGERFGLAIATLVLAIPLSAIGAAHAGLEGLLVSWAGIVGVNAVHVLRDSRWPRRGPTADREG
ncbi:hypothetical protein [Streptomyces sp. NPDC059176]|uniref:hypothetical protein n=1 Tax=unclassified Streptomyces TaxID=2593676 RepID=UPI003675E038